MEVICPICGNKVSDAAKQPRCPRCHTILKEIPQCSDCKSGCNINMKITIDEN
ncbi:hypothetical protein [Geosporobacter ferrireducens]|uniref:hypothetical protein n=1 Tax=Geosporobacter ferrireducens TaxID=1424294 RepID=UPI0012E9E289|nr:hypothetical protein [Geosporobacter ferrireducens]